MKNNDWHEAYFDLVNKVECECVQQGDLVPIWDQFKAMSAELAEFKALAETLAGELQQIEVDAMEYYNEWRETGCDQKDAIRFAFDLGEETRKALRQYKEVRDD